MNYSDGMGSTVPMRTFTAAFQSILYPQSSRMSRVLAVGLICAVALTMAAASRASVTPPVTWRPVETASTAFSRNPQVATDGDNGLTAVWTSIGSQQGIVYSDLRTDNSWSRPRYIPGSTTSSQAEDPVIAVSPNGNTVVAWSTDHYVQASIRLWNGSWTTAQTLGSLVDPSDTNWEMQAAINNDGTAVVVWEHIDAAATDYSIEAAFARGGTTFAAEQTIDGGAAASNAYTPDVVIDAAGNALVVYGYDNGVTDNVVRQSLAPANAAFAAPTAIDTRASGANSATHYPTLVADQTSGTVLGTWTDICDDAEVNCLSWPIVVALKGTVATGLGNKQRLSNPANGPVSTGPERQGWRPAVAIDQEQRGVVVWEANGGATDEIYSATNDDGGVFGDTTLVSATGISGDFDPEQRVAVADGYILVSWVDKQGGDIGPRIYTAQATHAPVPAFTSDGRVSDDTESDQAVIALSEGGYGGLFWRASSDEIASLTNAPADTTAPTLTIPAANTKLRVRSGKFRFKVGCPSAEYTCRGGVRFKRVGSSRVLTSKSYSLTGGDSSRLSMRLTRAARNLLAQQGTLKVVATITIKDRAGNQQTQTRRYKLV